MGEVLARPLDVDWDDPPEPGVFSDLTLTTAKGGPGVWCGAVLAVKAKQRSKKAVGLYAGAAKRCPTFRAEVRRMVASLPADDAEVSHG